VPADAPEKTLKLDLEVPKGKIIQIGGGGVCRISKRLCSPNEPKKKKEVEGFKRKQGINVEGSNPGLRKKKKPSGSQ